MRDGFISYGVLSPLHIEEANIEKLKIKIEATSKKVSRKRQLT